MKLIKASTLGDINLAGVTVEVQKVDDSIEAVVVTDVNGKYIRVVKGGAYTDTLKLLVEAPKEYKTQYKLSAKLNGVDVTYLSDNKHDVLNKMSELYIPEEDATIEEIQVEITANPLGDDLSSPF